MTSPTLERKAPSAQTAELPARFKAAMRGVAGTVTIVTATQGERFVGMAATAFSAVSMDPPSLLVCVNTDASIHAAIVKTRSFCVNILHRSNEPVCHFFGGKFTQEERFAATEWKATERGLPYLASSQATLECELSDSIDHGSHSIFVGNVLAARLGDAINPLLYLDGRYESIAARG
ncbi:FMN reductase (NADH) RutF [Variovorax sp. SRS16]|uniref:flavin reductase family protein n=1 Tax=Variovorax sp. SRS16 TaxID=282217 RepID=UPI001318E859|nr:flavin reductase family protein [Variovorax sp. SRS16]VTU12832.1 FMN reductase (NADH) RutF [Variovorax sp. SRS16]